MSFKEVSLDPFEGEIWGPLRTLVTENRGISLPDNKKVLIKDIIGTSLMEV